MLETEMADRETNQDTEITLGTGKLLGIFFGLVFVCGAFFTLGYMLGHNVGSAGASTQIIGTTTPAAGTRIVIVGKADGSTNITSATETLPIILPAT